MYKFDQDLEIRLARAFDEARMNRHEIITVEHLLIAILDDPSVAKVLLHHKVNVNKLRSDLSVYVKNNTAIRADTGEIEAVPTESFKRVFQRAFMRAQTFVAEKQEVTGAHVLMYICRERSPAAEYLSLQDLTSLDVEGFIQHNS